MRIRKTIAATMMVMAALVALTHFAAAETKVQPTMVSNDMLMSQPPGPSWLLGDVAHGTSKHVQGNGLYLVKLNAQGWMIAGGVTRSMGNKALDTWAVQWLRTWRFKPQGEVRYVMVPMSFVTLGDWNIRVSIPGVREYTSYWQG